MRPPKLVRDALHDVTPALLANAMAAIGAREADAAIVAWLVRAGGATREAAALAVALCRNALRNPTVAPGVAVTALAHFQGGHAAQPKPGNPT